MSNTNIDDGNPLHPSKNDSVNEPLLSNNSNKKISKEELDMIVHREKGLNGFGKPPVSVKDNFFLSLYLGFISFGGPIAHISMFKKILVEEKKYLNSSEFSNLFALCNFLPGPTSTQLFTAISTINSHSIFGGLINFLGFNMPGLVIMIFLALFTRGMTNDKSSYEDFSKINFFFLGVTQGAISLIIHAGYTLTKKQTKLNSFYLFLCFFSNIIYFLFQKYSIMMALMLGSGVANYIYKDNQIKNNIENKNNNSSINDDSLVMITKEKTEENKFDKYNHRYEVPLNEIHSSYNIKNINYIGLPCFVLFLSFYLILIIIRSQFQNNIYFLLCESFYRIGFLIFGGGHVVIPMILSEFTQLGLLTGKDVMIAFSFVSSIPGPMFNIAGYIGTVISGIIGGVLSALFIFLPGLLLTFSVLPFISNIKENFYLRTFLKGMSISAIGFIFSSVMILWIESCLNTNAYIGTVIIIIGLISLFKNINIFLVLLSSGVLSIIIHIVLLI